MNCDDYLIKCKEFSCELINQFEVDKIRIKTMTLSELRVLVKSRFDIYEKMSKKIDDVQTDNVVDYTSMFISRLVNRFGSLLYASDFLEVYCTRLENELKKCKDKKKVSKKQKE